MSVLFNIGALQSALAQSQNVRSDAGLKASMKLYTEAAGTFHHLAEASAKLGAPPSPDLAHNCCAALSAMLAAQGQEAYVRKVRRSSACALLCVRRPSPLGSL